jgi:hypothetical protein
MQRNKKFHTPLGRIPRIPPFYVADMGKLALAAHKLQATEFPTIPALPLSALRRFHVVTGLHPDFMPMDEEINLIPSRHAVEESQNEWEEKRVRVFLPTRLNMEKVKVVEQGIYHDRLDRLLVRVKHDAQWDLVMSLFWRVRPGTPKGIITAWVNRTSDRHYTLGKGVYERP